MLIQAKSSISPANPEWLPWVALGWLFCLVLLIFFYRNLSSLPLGKRIAAITLKLFGLLLLALCLLELVWIKEVPQTGRNIVAIVADTSRSLKITEQKGKPSRADVAIDILQAKDKSFNLVEQLESIFLIRPFSIDNRLASIAGFDSLTYEGGASRLNTGISDLVRRFDGEPLSAIVMVSDGNHTDSIDQLNTDTLPPVYIVAPGSDLPKKDLGIDQVTVTESAFEDAPITIEAQALNRGYNTATVKLIRASNGETVQTKEIKFDGNGTKKVRFTFRPTEPGVSFYTLSVACQSPESEATLANNSQVITVEQNQGPHRILYISGRPNWDFKFFRRALVQDQSFRLSALQRIAKREPKFQWRGRTGEESNPLFRGFGREEETQDYDEPVLIRLVVQDDAELTNGFPIETEDLYPYKAIVIDDLEADFFSPDQQELLQTFVSKRGGALLFLGGTECFADGGYENSLLADLLPVYLGKGSEAVPIENEVRMGLTREGMLEFWLRLRQLEAQENARLRNMNSFSAVNQVRSIKPGASLFATVQNTQTNKRQPALAVQRFGAGKVAASTIGDMWRWGFLDPNQTVDRDKSWRQLMRHLIVDTPNRSEIKISHGTSGSQEKRIEVRLKNKNFDPQYNGIVTLSVTDPKGDVYTFPANPDDVEPGLYQGVFLANEDGGYRVKAEVKPIETDELYWEPVETGWSINRDAQEFASIGINYDWINRITSETGGAIVKPSELRKLPKLIANNEVSEIEIKTTPLWHTPWFLILAIACFVGEWAIRRNHGLV